MSRLDELIEELCPEGVEYLEVKEIFEISAGGDVPKKFYSEEQTEEFKIPIISNGIEDKSVYGWTNIEKISNPSLTISARGTIGWTAYRDYSFYPIVRLLVLTPVVKMNLKYAYYHMKSIENDYMVPKVGIPQLTKPMIEKCLIPLPPLSIQEEIVRILDDFTELTAKLTAELTSELTVRKNQYEYYRDTLLEFGDEVEWKYLGDISKNLDSMRKPITSGARECGTIPYYGASGIVDYVKDYILDGDYLLVSEDGANLIARNTPIAFSAYGKIWVNNHAHILEFKTCVERRYVEYYLNALDLTPYISGAAQPKLNQKNLNKISIPVPSLEEQQRIVDLLDSYDTLCHDITADLSAEIKARQQQYEYYRDKLLTFKRLENAE